MTRAFAPLLTRSAGAVVDILTIVALASMPAIAAYNASKAAAWSLTQSLRADLSGLRITKPSSGSSPAREREAQPRERGGRESTGRLALFVGP